MRDTPQIYRIILEASNFRKSIEFYTSLLDTSGRDVGGNRYYFDCGPVILALLDIKPSHKIPQFVYFAVNNLEEVINRAEKLKCLSKDMVHGSPAGEIVVRPWGERSFYAADPDGNGLCFVDEKTLFTGK